MLFQPVLHDNEALLVQGFETFSCYKGYGRTLRYGGPCHDTAQVRYVSTGPVIVLPSIYCATADYRRDTAKDYITFIHEACIREQCYR